MGTSALIIFAKYPHLGQVKTRLTPFFGRREALEFYTAMMLDSLDRLHSLVPETFLFLSGCSLEEGCGFVEENLDSAGIKVRLQEGRNLGERMNRAYKSVSLCSISRREPVDRVVIVGTDSPSLPIDYVRMAFRALEESAVVIGPVRDGGYYLIGFSRDCPEAFKDINWGSSRVMRETLSRLGSQAYKALPEWYDIDVEQDIYLLWDDLESLFEGYPKRTRAFLCAQNIDTGNRF